MKTTISQENLHHAHHKWTIFAVSKWKKQAHSKITENIRSLQFFMILHVKVKISYIYPNAEYANFNTLVKVRLLLTPVWTTLEKVPNQKKSISTFKHFSEPKYNFQRHAKFTLIEKIRENRENFWILKQKTLYADGLNQELNDNDWL